MTPKATPANKTALLRLFQFEKELRQAGKLSDLAFVLVNQLRGLVPFDSATLIAVQKKVAKPVQASDVARIDPNAPYIRWQADVIGHFLKSGSVDSAGWLPLKDVKDQDRRGYQEWGSNPAFWLPLITPAGRLIGGLWLSREGEFRPEELALLEKVSEVAAHAWAAFDHGWSLSFSASQAKLIAASVTVILFLVMFIPVQQTVLAPAEVVAREPAIVTAPMNGVIETVAVSPNDPVKEGSVLLRYDATEVTGRLAVAEEELLVAQSELMSAQQASFVDPRVKGELAVLRSRMALRKTERDYARSILDKVVLLSPRDGVAVFRDKADLEGTPVQTGQSLIQIADPLDTELLIELPVADASVFETGADVTLFLDHSPLHPIDAKLRYSSYTPEPTASGILSYYMKASFTGIERPRLGLRGTARIAGDDVSLFFFLFRRPISVFRQLVGW